MQERFSFRAQNQEITLANYKGHQSKLKRNKYREREVRETNASKLRFVLVLLLIVGQKGTSFSVSQSPSVAMYKPKQMQISFDTHIKTALLCDAS